MDSTFTKVFLKQLIIQLIVAYVVFSSPTKISKRSITSDVFTGPCFVLHEEAPSETRPFSESIADLKTRTAGLIADSHNLKSFMKSHYGFNDMTATYLDTLNWMSEEEFIASATQKEAAITQSTEALISHFHLLAENVLYIEQARTVGPIGEKKSASIIREKLHEFEMKLYNCMCSIKIALLSKGSDVTTRVTEEILNTNFVSYASPLEKAKYRTYVTLQDSIELLGFLNTIYAEIEMSLSSNGI